MSDGGPWPALPGRLDSDAPFVPLGIAVLVVSDSRTLASDESGRILEARAAAAGHRVVGRQVVPDEVPAIVAALEAWLVHPDVQVILATGGTGLTGRDVTPEAFARVVEKEIPGFGELFRWISLRTIGTTSIHSRAMAGVAKGRFLFALPGSRGAVRDAWDGILVHQLDSRHRPSNFVDLLPRLTER